MECMLYSNKQKRRSQPLQPTRWQPPARWANMATMSDEQTHKYPGDQVEVSWDGRLCIHVGECGRAEGELFVGGRDPWCDPGKAGSVQEVVEVCERCPTGALTYIRKDNGGPELSPGRNQVVVANDGPLYLTGDLSIDGAAEGMTGVRTRAALCRCGASKNKPFCDGAHRTIGFTAD